MDAGPDDHHQNVCGEAMRRGPEVYRECAARGLSKSEAARELGVCVQAVVYMAQQYDIFFRDGRDKG